jgi:2-hydroxy-3-keto-5-methylthiopentenyl-1-phosphate phosphatase
VQAPLRDRPAIYCDFDGTISTRDVIDAFLERFADKEWITIEEDWKAGKINARDCLRRQLRCVPPMERAEVEEFLKTIQIDPYFTQLLNFANENEIPFFIVSDGFDWFIESVLRNHSVEGLTTFSNLLTWSKTGLTPEFALASQDCKAGSGVCKCKIVEGSEEKYFKIYIGDGRSDFCVAPAADLLFAKGSLKTYCEDRKIAYRGYTTLLDVMVSLAPVIEQMETQSLPKKVVAR